MEQEEEIVIEELTEEQITRRKYARIAAFSLLAVILLMGFMCAFSGDSEEPKVEEVPEETEPSTGLVSLIELSKVKNIPTQYYNAGDPLIANTPEELLIHLRLDGWSAKQVPLALGYSRVFTDISTREQGRQRKVTIWMRVFSSRDQGREELKDTLEKSLKDNNIIVSENWDIGSGGFVTNDGVEISNWFYYEPNIVARATMLKNEGGTLQEVTDWAHRINYSIYNVLN